ncbi:hypothetical protein N7474_008133 [Penicillium riverlandense]|uniref:uncharacterized protein n=1 Tax=Penicillium riverlandense TaxID=1903569 RepID=UPI00254757E3|nr:uncharacterized protein N7474_008133 [Penicillium riverlandense]KAJ5811832.1 hypothetical protein N7474_008133 [Penicillium riverlandense]
MGRPPKKRARSDEEDVEPPVRNIPTNEIWPSPEDPQSSPWAMVPDPTAATDIPHLCPQVFWHHHNEHSQPTSDSFSGQEDQNHTWHPDRLLNANLPVPPSSSPWPDFMTVTEATGMPFSPLPTFPNMQSPPSLSPPTPTSSSDSSGPGCTCLSYLYLCLSHISSLASFPVNSHNICSLYIAVRTAQHVIRCESCPKNFATGVQNIMFTGTLLTVVADAWLRVFKANAAEIGMQAASPSYVSRVLQSADPAKGWENWLRQVVRHAVIGGHMDPDAQPSGCNQPDLLSVIQEIEDRQRRWHHPGHQHWPPHPTPLGRPHLDPNDPENSCDEKDLLCLRVVGNARRVISSFGFEPHEYPEGVAPPPSYPS